MAAHQTTRLTHHKLTFQSETATYYNTYAVEHTLFSAVPPPQRAQHTLLLPLVFPKQTPVLAGGRWRAVQHFGRNHTIQEVYFFLSLTEQNSVNYNTSYQLNSSDLLLLCAHVFVQHGELESEAGVCTFRSNN